MKQHPESENRSRAFVPVRFELSAPAAKSVCLAGTFNSWCASSKPMHLQGDGRWVKETTLQPGAYEYCFVVDGHWLPDPEGKDYVPNPFGGRNSVLIVHAAPTAADPSGAEPHGRSGQRSGVGVEADGVARPFAEAGPRRDRGTRGARAISHVK